MEKERQVIDIYVIRDWPEVNPRRDYDEGQLNLLGESLVAEGQVDAVKVNGFMGPSGFLYQLIDGKRRVQAAKRAGLQEIEADVYFDLSLCEAMRLVGATLQKQEFNVVEEARLISGWHANGDTLEHICHITGKSDTTVLNRIKIANHLCEDVQEMMIRKTNSLPIHQALLLCKLNAGLQAELAKMIAPLTGPVMAEDEARELIKRRLNKQMDLDSEADDNAVEEAVDPKSAIKNQQSQTLPSGGPTEGPQSTGDRTPSGPSRSSKPGPGTNKDPNMVGIKGEVPVVITIEGTLLTKRTGVKVHDAKLTLEAGTVTEEVMMDVLCFDIGSDDIKYFCDFSQKALRLPDDGNAQR